MKRILQLSTYPIKRPLHGGQIRVSEIRKYFEKSGCDVKSISLSEMSHSDYDEKDDFILDNFALQKACNVTFCTDYATSVLSKMGKPYKFIEKQITKFKPDIILIEQVWLWPAVKHMCESKIISSKVKIIYSSQNIEYITKQSLLESHGISGKNVDAVIGSIHALEKELSEVADYAIACTSSDAKVFENMGSKCTLVCNNGVAQRRVNQDEVTRINNLLMGRKYILFVGSAYPPNALGFWQMMGSTLAWLAPDTMILAAGGVSKILEDYISEEDKLYSSVSMDRIINLGFVSEELLGALVNQASVIILPITVGGGSNLKTAEAIASCRPVVATTVACRGFEITNDLSNFVVADTKDDFIKATLSFLNDESLKQINDLEKKNRESVFWENSLASLKEILK